VWLCGYVCKVDNGKLGPGDSVLWCDLPSPTDVVTVLTVKAVPEHGAWHAATLVPALPPMLHYWQCAVQGLGWAHMWTGCVGSTDTEPVPYRHLACAP